MAVFPQNYTFRGLSDSAGMNDLTVTAIFKDSLGYVWIGTTSSVERFDGVSIKHYVISGDDEKRKRVYAFTELPNNLLIMGNGMGIWNLDDTKKKWVQVATDSITSGVHSLLYEEGVLFIGSENGLYVWKDDKLSHFLGERDILTKTKEVDAMTLDGKGQLWMATNVGLYSLRLKDNYVEFHPLPNTSNISFTSVVNLGNMLYLGTSSQGIFAYDTMTHEFAPYVNVGCNVISCLSTNEPDKLYVGTDGNGICCISVSRKQVIQSISSGQGEHGLRSSSVYALLVDRDGIIWAGLHQMGLDYSLFHNNLFTMYSYPPLFDSMDMVVRAIYIDENVKLIGTRNGFYYIDEKKKQVVHIATPQLRSNMIFCIYPAHGNYYIGTFGGGISVFDPQTFAVSEFDPSQDVFVHGQIFDITADQEGNVWVSTGAGLFQYRDSKEVAHFTSKNSHLPEGNVYEIFFDSANKGWVLTDNGMCIWDPSQGLLRTDVFPDGFASDKKMRSMYEDSDHRLYFMLDNVDPENGSLFISDLSLSEYGYLNGTPIDGHHLMFMIEDRDHWLWIGSDKGIYRYDRKETFVPYTYADGIPDPNFFRCTPIVSHDGNIWFGNSKGLLYLDMSLIDEAHHSRYPLTVTDVVAQGECPETRLVKVNDKEYVAYLTPSQKDIIVSITNFIYSDPSLPLYEYKAEGRDKEWKSLSSQMPLTLTHLSAGTRHLKIRCIDDPSSEITLTIKKEAIVKWWMIVFLCCLGCGIAIGMRKYVRWLRMPQNASEKEVISTEEEEKYKTYRMTPKEADELGARLESVIYEQKLHLRPDLKIGDLASIMGVSQPMLSYYFNQQLQRNYYEYINDYRIEEFKARVARGDLSKYTIIALAEQCGFVSKASFFRYFKTATGVTPSKYVQQMGQNE